MFKKLKDTKVFRDPLYGNIKIDYEIILDLIDTDFRSPSAQLSSAAPACPQTSAGLPTATASPSHSYHPGGKRKWYML